MAFVSWYSVCTSPSITTDSLVHQALCQQHHEGVRRRVKATESAGHVDRPAANALTLRRSVLSCEGRKAARVSVSVFIILPLCVRWGR